jgi:hypothetical protein
MALPSSGPLFISDIYDEAVSGGNYSGSKFLSELANGVNWFPNLSAAQKSNPFISDFRGKSVQGNPTLNLTVKITNNTGNTLQMVTFDPGSDPYHPSRSVFRLSLWEDTGLGDGVWYIDNLVLIGNPVYWPIGTDGTPDYLFFQDDIGSNILNGQTKTVVMNGPKALSQNINGFSFRLLTASSNEFTNCTLTLDRVPFATETVTLIAPSQHPSGWGWDRAYFANDANNYFPDIFKINGDGTVNITMTFTFT